MLKIPTKLIILLFSALLITSCEAESDDIITDETTEIFRLYDYYVDEYGNEGVVAYLEEEASTHEINCIIVISSDESIEPWGPMGELVYNRDSVSSSVFGTASFGVAILQSMKSMGIERFPAQAWCDQKNGNEPFPRAGSWRLPSYKELKLIFGSTGSHVGSLNNALVGIGGTVIHDDTHYWTCVEDFDNYITINGMVSDYDKENRAVLTTPANYTFGNKDHWIKKNRYHVRAIKYIYFKS